MPEAVAASEARKSVIVTVPCSGISACGTVFYPILIISNLFWHLPVPGTARRWHSQWTSQTCSPMPHAVYSLEEVTWKQKPDKLSLHKNCNKDVLRALLGSEEDLLLNENVSDVFKASALRRSMWRSPFCSSGSDIWGKSSGSCVRNRLSTHCCSEFWDFGGQFATFVSA